MADQTQLPSMTTTVDIVKLEELLMLLQRYEVCTYQSRDLHLELGVPEEIPNSDEVKVLEPRTPPTKAELSKAKFLSGIDPRYHQFYNEQ